MSLSWYSISISLQSGGSPFFNGYFSVNTTTNTIYHFVNANSTTVNLLTYPTNNYDGDNKFISGNFSFGGTVISNIPPLNNQYGASAWNIWYSNGDTFPNMSFKSSTDGYWYDVVGNTGNYGTIFSFSIASTSAPASIPSTILKTYYVMVYDKVISSNICVGALVVEFNINII